MIHTLFDLCKRNLCLLGAYSLAFLLLLTACNDKDEYYERPSWLEPPIYDVLMEKGNFTLYLEAIDRTLYSSVLKRAGNYTVFAPNDDAFQRFLSEKGYTSISDIPVDELTKIISYSMVFNKFESLHLGDVIENKVWSKGTSIKKRSSYYKTLYKEEVNGEEQWVVDSPTDVTVVVTPYKYIPVFTQSYFSQHGLNALDYETFFPVSSFSGLNAGAGRILNKDMYAENGVIHEVDAVNYPIENLDEMLKSDKHKAFRDILESKVENSYMFVSYLLGKDATEVYKKLYPDRNISEVYCKTYINLPFLLNNENYKGKETATTEQQGYTLLVPSNEAVNAFVESVTHRAEVERMSDLSLETLTYFLQAHMVSGLIWPSQFQTAMNENGEYLNGAGKNGPVFDACVAKSTFASNGILYDTPDVVKSKYFNTVYSEILLNKSCRDLVRMAYTTYFTSDWIVELTKSPLTGFTAENYTLLLPSDELLAGDGYSYDDVNKKFLNANASAASISVDDRLKRLLRMCIIKRTNGETELKDFSGSPELGYDGYGFAVNAYGDMIRFKNNKVQGIGNILDNVEVEVEEMTDFTYNNGRVFKINKLLQYSPRETVSDASGWKDGSLYETITNYTTVNNGSQLFKKYLDRAYGGTSPSFIKASTFYTVLIPTDDAINKAVAEGKIPALPSGSKEFSLEEMSLVETFLKLCFLSGEVVADDGLSCIEPEMKKTSLLTTSHTITEASVDLWSAKTYVEAFKNSGDNILKFRFQNISEGTWIKVEGEGEVTVVRGFNKSNYMGPLSVIHAIDNIIWFHINENN